MSIPKVIYQTFKSKKAIPLLARFHIWNMRRMNPEYEYRFYDDAAIEKFLQEEFDDDVYEQYRKVDLGAATADFFRYAVLLKKGRIYLDIDSRIAVKLSKWIKDDDRAIITRERNPGLYVQWALIYDKGHPFLKEILDTVIDNIKQNRYPHSVVKMTGPVVYRDCIDRCIKNNVTEEYRIDGTDYEGKIKFKFLLSGITFNKKDHWKKVEKLRPVISEK